MNNMLVEHDNYGYPYNNPFLPYYGQNMYNSLFLPLPDPKNYNKGHLAVFEKGKKNKKKNDKINEYLI